MAETKGAKAFESRLYAPCCYGGTLDIHESELARELRKEIEDRFAHGESAESVQADFVARYGDKVLAARSDSAIRSAMIVLGGLLLLAAGALALLLRRWKRRDTPAGTTPRDVFDDRIDAELAELD